MAQDDAARLARLTVAGASLAVKDDYSKAGKGNELQAMVRAEKVEKLAAARAAATAADAADASKKAAKLAETAATSGQVRSQPKPSFL